MHSCLQLLLISLVAMTTYVASQRTHASVADGLDQESTAAQSEDDLYLSPQDSPECQPCSCPSVPPTCAPGVSMVRDGCGCCKVCARQLAQACDVRHVCDFHKGLYCDAESRVCKASPGRPCNVGGKWYENGELFQPSCRATCSCIDGDLGCVPACSTPLSSPSSLTCPHPRLIRRKGQCCGEWVCLKNGKLGKNMLPFGNEAKGRKKMKVTFKDSCMVQTTDWSPCSKTCGFGISDRVSNDNPLCKMKKQIRLCNLRPCSMKQSSVTSRKKPCRKNIRHNKRVQFSLSGCLSADIYRPKYCGFCGDKCCKPKSTKTVTVEFICKSHGNSTSSFTRDMMLIRKCSCHECIHDNSIFSVAFAGMGSDTERLT